MKYIMDKIRQLGSATTERPHVLEADVLARYTFAKKYCKDKNVLDIGTGFGMGAEYISKNGANFVMGIDYDKRAIEKANFFSSKKLTFKTINALDIEKLQKKFDVILAFEIIEHLPVTKVNEFIEKLSNLLTKDGVLLITTPNGIYTKYFWGKPYNPYHIIEYRPEELETLSLPYFPSVTLKGFTCIDKKYRSTQKYLEKSFLYKISYFIGHFKIAREFLAYIPKDIKHLVTKENTLPSLSDQQYTLQNDYKTEGLFMIAKKINGEKYKKPDVSVIIANYNGEKYLTTVLESLIRNSLKNFEVIICDDGSTDKSVSIIYSFMKKDKRIRLCQNDRNKGAAASRNYARMFARSEYLIFLDNDTETDENFLEELYYVITKNSSVGACQAKVRDFEKRDTIQTAGCLLWAGTGWGLPQGQWEKDNGRFDKKFPIVATSVALIVKTKIFDEVAGFDSDEGVFTEDIDFSWKVWISGYKIILAPKAIVYHWTKNISMRKNMKHSMEIIYFHLAKNSLTSIWKNYQFINSCKYFIYALAVLFGRGLLVLVKRNDFSALIGTYRGMVWFVKNIFSTLRKRTYIQSKRKYDDNYLLQTIIVDKNPITIYNNYYSTTKLL